MTTQERDAQYAKFAEELAADANVPKAVKELADDPRVAVRRAGAPDKGKCVVYWMQRAQRGRDNHAMDKAVDVGNALGLPVVAFFAGINNFVHANARHYAFLNQGLPDIEEDCEARGVGFVMRRYPHHELTKFLEEVGAVMVVGDENPMRAPEAWRVKLAETVKIPYWTVDADVIVPSKLLLKAQFSAGVARPRLYRALPEFLVPYENPKAKVAWKRPRGLHADDVRKDMTQGWPEFDRSVPPVEYWKGGHHAGMKRLKYFCDHLLEDYDTARNDPSVDGTSRMSPYLHFGHVCNLTIALAVADAAKKHPKLKAAKDSFFNEVIAWRELSVNFVRYQPEYDSPKCADNWAKLTIAKHDRDEREHLYTRKQLEDSKTYDELWNAAQLQMVRFGWMHNYLRMYWAKKILEWTPNAEKAMEIAIWLNDRYEIDGRDPDGYSGIAWAMLGKFDRAWGERPVFGKRRYMSGASTSKKFDAKAYIEMVEGLGNRQEGQGTGRARREQARALRIAAVDAGISPLRLRCASPSVEMTDCWGGFPSKLVGMKRALVVLGLLSGVCVGGAEKPKPVLVDANARVGVISRVFHPEVRRNWRGVEKKELDVVIWYPAIDTAIETKQFIGPPDQPLFEAGSATPSAPFAPHLEKMPMVVLSHGSGGSALQMAWLGTALARAGYIAVAVDHPGNNQAAPLTPEGFALWWERATDVSNVIDGMLKDGEFGPRLDATRIAAAGYSLGGYTVLELVGAQTDIGLFFDRCRVGPDAKPAGDQRLTNDAAVCRVPEMHGLPSNEAILAYVRKTSGESLARSGASYKDARVKAVFAIAPALGFTQTAESLRAVRVPVEMVVGTEDRIAPANENADYLRANLKAGRETVLPGVSHYTFLDTCTAAGKTVVAQYCGEAPGVERDAVHAKVSGMAVVFFDRELKWR